MSARAFTKLEENASVHQALAPPVPPLYFDATAITILSTTHELIEANERLYSMIAQTSDPAAATFGTTSLPIIQIIHEENILLCERQLTVTSADTTVEKRAGKCDAHIYVDG